MSAELEAIVRRLAAVEDMFDESFCPGCGKDRWQDTDHEPECPWRMAREWVQTHDG